MLLDPLTGATWTAPRCGCQYGGSASSTGIEGRENDGAMRCRGEGVG